MFQNIVVAVVGYKSAENLVIEVPPRENRPSYENATIFVPENITEFEDASTSFVVLKMAATNLAFEGHGHSGED